MRRLRRVDFLTTAQYAAMPRRIWVPRKACSRMPQRRKSRTEPKRLRDRAASPDHEEQDDYGADHVRKDAEGSVAKARAENQLHEDCGRGDQRQVADRGRAGVIEFGEIAHSTRDW